MYASRMLTDSETRYSQIEKETLGIVFACEKFHQFTYDHKILIENDQQSLLATAKKKNICEMPPRPQRFSVYLLKYNYDLRFVPGKDLLLADMLTRTPAHASDPATTEDV